jgi:hypothetical protein
MRTVALTVTMETSVYWDVTRLPIHLRDVEPRHKQVYSLRSALPAILRSVEW